MADAWYLGPCQGRFKGSSLWGDGWGWSLFNADDPKHTTSQNYKTDCLPCHTPAKGLAPRNAVDEDKWIYTFGYPVLQRKKPYRRGLTPSLQLGS